MNFGTVINVSIGLIMTFAIMALVVSGAREAAVAFFKVRATNLREGIQNLLNDPTMTGLAGRLFAHAAIHPLGTANPVRGKAPPTPSYIAPQQFASVLIDLIQNPDPASKLGLKEAIDKVEDPQIKALLSGAYDRVNGDVVRFHEELAGWFDGAMNRVSDNFKRNSQKWSFLIALGLAVFLNVDAFHIAQAIWANPEMVAAVGALKDTSSTSMQELTRLAAAGFPMGWTDPVMDKLKTASGPGLAMQVIGMLLGWLFTAAAAMLGAPFWFGLLNQIRGSTSAPAQPAPAVAPAPVAAPAAAPAVVN